MVDAQSVDEALGEPALHLDVGGVEDRPVLLPQSRQRGDREEASVTADIALPSDERIVLSGMHLRAGGAVFCGARCNGPAALTQWQQVPVNRQLIDVAVVAQYGKNHP